MMNKDALIFQLEIKCNDVAALNGSKHFSAIMAQKTGLVIEKPAIMAQKKRLNQSERHLIMWISESNLFT